MAVPSLAAAPAPAPLRPRVLLVGAALGGLTGAMAIFTMLGVYLARRADLLNRGETWLPQGSSIPLPQPNMMFFTLLLSAVTMAWAAYALRRDDRQNAYVALGLTALLMVAYVVLATYFFTIVKLPVRAPEGQGVLFWSISGSHLVMVIVGIAFLVLTAIRVLSGQDRRIPEGITAVAVYWGITIGVYAVIWYAVYVTK
jgi:heme/copper-type cytochrome/quinol oxidase subunit 3